MYRLTNSQLTLSIDGETGCFSIHPRSDRFPRIQAAQMMLTVWIARERFQIPLKLDEQTIERQSGKPLFPRTREELHCRVDTGMRVGSRGGFRTGERCNRRCCGK
jgi:hypothetical protein